MQKPLLSFQEEKLHAPEISIEGKLNGRCKIEEEGGNPGSMNWRQRMGTF